MPEYDPNLPQEFTRTPKHSGAAGVAIAVVLAAALVTLALYALTHSMPPMGDNMRDNTAANQKTPNTPPRVQKE